MQPVSIAVQPVLVGNDTPEPVPLEELRLDVGVQRVGALQQRVAHAHAARRAAPKRRRCGLPAPVHLLLRRQLRLRLPKKLLALSFRLLLRLPLAFLDQRPAPPPLLALGDFLGAGRHGGRVQR